jgi:hypothetical protein
MHRSPFTIGGFSSSRCRVVSRLGRGVVIARPYAALLICALTGVLAFGGASAWAGQIVYQHAGEIWAMNDDGSDQHSLFGVAQVPAMTSIGEPDIFPNGGTAIAFEGETTANIDESSVSCGVNCEGIYTFAEGTVSRVTGPPAPCTCSSFSDFPHWMANGELQDNYEFIGRSQSINAVSATADAGEGTPLGVPSAEWGGGFTVGPWGAPDPADATKLVSIGPEEPCNTFFCHGPRNLYVTTGGSAHTPIGAAEWFVESPEWSSDGSRLAVLQGGEERGIWTLGPEEAAPSKHFVFALRDPIQLGKSEPLKTTFSGVSWIGSSEIVFAAQGDIWTIPAGCGTDGTPCEFPANATQLTSDGQDGSPSWTSSTQSLVPPAASSGGSGTSSGSSPGPANHAGAVVSSAQIASLLAGEMTPVGRGARLARLLRAGAFALTFTAPEAGSATVGWYFLPPHARLARRKRAKPVLVATGSHVFPAAGTATIEIRLTRAGKDLLRRAGHVQLTAKGVFMPVGSSSPVSVVRQFAIRR